MADLEETWQDTVTNLFDSHGVREPLLDILTWENPKQSAVLFMSGVGLYFVTNVLGLGLMMVIGITAILQLLLFRAAKYVQEKGIALQGTNLKEEFVVTPAPETVSTIVHVIGDIFRIVEDSVRSLALSKDFIKLGEGFISLIFLAAAGSVMDLPTLLLVIWTLAFTILPIYKGNQSVFDSLLDASGASDKYKEE